MKHKNLKKLLAEAPKFRWAPDPHRRHNVVSNKKTYSRKARPETGPYDFPGLRWIAAAAGLLVSTVAASAGEIPFKKAPQSIQKWVLAHGDINDPKNNGCGLMDFKRPSVTITRKVFSFGVAYIAVPYTGCTGSGAGLFSVWMTKGGKLTMVLNGEGPDPRGIVEEDGKIVSYGNLAAGLEEICRSVYGWKGQKLVDLPRECATQSQEDGTIGPWLKIEESD